MLTIDDLTAAIGLAGTLAVFVLAVRNRPRKKSVTVLTGKLSRAYEDDLGYDLYCDEDFYLSAGASRKVSTGLRLDMQGVGAHIEDKSGLAGERITTRGRVIDPGFRGEIKVVLVNEDLVNGKGFVLGTKIAQIEFRDPCDVPVKGDVEQGKGKRGAKGFGSSGAK